MSGSARSTPKMITVNCRDARSQWTFRACPGDLSSMATSCHGFPTNFTLICDDLRIEIHDKTQKSVTCAGLAGAERARVADGTYVINRTRVVDVDVHGRRGCVWPTGRM
jgi:hypothetical protein